MLLQRLVTLTCEQRSLSRDGLRRRGTFAVLRSFNVLRRWAFAALPPAFSGLIVSARGFSLGGKATEFDGTNSSIDASRGNSSRRRACEYTAVVPPAVVPFARNKQPAAVTLAPI